MTYIAYDAERKPISIVVATNQGAAEVYWGLMNIDPFEIKCAEVDFHLSRTGSASGVRPILVTERTSVRMSRTSSYEDVILVREA